MYDHDIVFHFCAPPRRLYLLTALAARLPRSLSGWGLLSGVIEETTLLISRSYTEAGDDADPVFAWVHMLHAQDEARHCVIGSLIAEWLIDAQRGWVKRANATVFDLMFQAYYDPGWGYDRPIRRLVADFPDLRDREAETIGQAMRALLRQSHRVLVQPGDVAHHVSECQALRHAEPGHSQAVEYYRSLRRAFGPRGRKMTPVTDSR